MYYAQFLQGVYQETHSSWVVVVAMYGEDRDGHIVVGVFIVHYWEPEDTHTYSTTQFTDLADGTLAEAM